MQTQPWSATVLAVVISTLQSSTLESTCDYHSWLWGWVVPQAFGKHISETASNEGRNSKCLESSNEEVRKRIAVVAKRTGQRLHDWRPGHEMWLYLVDAFPIRLPRILDGYADSRHCRDQLPSRFRLLSLHRAACFSFQDHFPASLHHPYPLHSGSKYAFLSGTHQRPFSWPDNIRSILRWCEFGWPLEVRDRSSCPAWSRI